MPPRLYSYEQPTSSTLEAQAALESIRPTTGDVVNTMVEDVFKGDGSAYQTKKAIDVKLAKGTPITREAWDADQNKPKGVDWYEGMTSESAAILADLQQQREAREYITGQATGSQIGAGFLVSFGAGIFEPQNLAIGAVVGAGIGEVVTAPALSGIKAMARLGKIYKSARTYKKLAAVGAVEGVVSGVAAEPLNRYAAEVTQSDYGIADSLMNVATSAAFGAGFRALPKFARNVFVGRERAALLNHVDAIAESVLIGDTPDVDAIAARQALAEKQAVANQWSAVNRERVERLSQLTDAEQQNAKLYDQLAELETQRKLAQYNINVDPKLADNVIAAIDAITAKIATPKDAPGYAGLVEGADRAADYLDNLGFDREGYFAGLQEGKTYKELAEGKGFPLTEYENATKALSDLQEQRAAEREGIQGKKLEKKLREFDAETEKRVGALEAQIARFLERNDINILADVQGEYNAQRVPQRKGDKKTLRPIDEQIASTRAAITGPDRLANIRSRIAELDGQLASMPTVEELSAISQPRPATTPEPLAEPDLLAVVSDLETFTLQNIEAMKQQYQRSGIELPPEFKNIEDNSKSDIEKLEAITSCIMGIGA